MDYTLFNKVFLIKLLLVISSSCFSVVCLEFMWHLLFKNTGEKNGSRKAKETVIIREPQSTTRATGEVVQTCPQCRWWTRYWTDWAQRSLFLTSLSCQSIEKMVTLPFIESFGSHGRLNSWQTLQVTLTAYTGAYQVCLMYGMNYYSNFCRSQDFCCKQKETSSDITE